MSGDTIKHSVPSCVRLWSIKDVSDFLGVPTGTLYQWRTRGEGPPCIRLGKHLRFDPARVRSWVAEQEAA